MDCKVYIETMGCQMNKLDSELVEGQLRALGYEFTDEQDEAGVVIFNTCSVRQHAEDKVISKLGQLLRRHKKGGLVLAVVGCMAQRWGEQMLDDYKQVDVVCGPGQLHKLGELIEEARQGKRTMALNDEAVLEELEELDMGRPKVDSDKGFMAYVRVMRGCNKFCHYCVVPFVRGRERSRPIEHVVEETRRLVDNGVKEITLLGQTVNSYKYGAGEKTYGLADVLEKVHEISGLERLRFVTSYPRDFDERIFEAMAELPKVCEYLHIPAQSGSDRILQAMNRRYTAKEYVALIERGREVVEGLTVAGDFILGYCGETEEDFEATKELIRQVRYKNCFIFKYSPRPGTKAQGRMADDVPEEVKKRRNYELLELQNSISLEENQRFIGSKVEILVEGPSKNPHLNNRDDDNRKAKSLQLVGRTRGDHIVVFDGEVGMIGQLVTVEVVRASALTLFGRA